MEETAGPRSPQFSKRLATQPRACEQCHRRKIRCDRRLPCSNCQIADLQCKASTRRSVMARIQPGATSQTDDRLSRIEEQLSIIQQTLTTLQDRVTNSVSPHRPPISQAGITVRTSCENNKNVLGTPRERTPVKFRDVLTYEGESSLSVQSCYANRIFKDVIQRNSPEDTALNIDREVLSLDKALNRDDPRSAFHENPFPGGATQKIAQAKIEWPPLNEISLLLRWARGPNPPILLSFLPLVTIFDLTQLCKKAYFAVEECSTSDLIIINSCLLFLLPKFSIAHNYDESITENCHHHASLCQRNLETALADLNLFMNLSLDNTKAPVLASMYAIGISSLSMAWTLTSTAARVCQSLGYGHLLSKKETNIENVDTKKTIFGYVYILDKTLSLRLGQPSSMHEYELGPDISIAMSTKGPQSWDFVWYLWIEVATIHGRTFEQLYSLQAMNIPPQARLEAVERLSALTIAAKRKNSKLGDQIDRADNCRLQYLSFIK
ncbi:hypothetical protein BGZ60DRAFT_404977 [Tricladium varicosporioides]|nr:hypothetical protein BGZ60DRAFT_404977 [Hymenoscyphus varicosporioides]